MLSLMILFSGSTLSAPATGAFVPDAVVDLSFDPQQNRKKPVTQPETPGNPSTSIESYIPDMDPCLRTAYGETLYRDTDLDFAEVDIEEEYKLARMAFLFGRYEYAYKIWEPLAYEGNAKAQATLGWMFHSGKGVRQNLKRAFNWYRLAAQQNHIVAQNNMGVFYEKGISVSKNYRKAAKWYREAAELGYPYAQYNLGVLYHKGRGVKKDRNEAIFWLQIASLQGVKAARTLLEDWGNLPKKHKGKVNPVVRFHASKRHYELNQQVKEGQNKDSKTTDGDNIKTANKDKKRPKKQSPKQQPVTKASTSQKTTSKQASDKKRSSQQPHPKQEQTERTPTRLAGSDSRNPHTKPMPPQHKKIASAPTKPAYSLVRDSNWVMQQNPNHYTLQLAGSTDLRALLTIAGKVSTPSKLAYYSVYSRQTNQEWFNLLYGRFRDEKSASMQLKELDPELKRYKPWITQFSTIQKRLRK